MILTPVRLTEITEHIAWKLLYGRFQELKKESENPSKALKEMCAKEFGISETELQETFEYLFEKYSPIPARQHL